MTRSKATDGAPPVSVRPLGPSLQLTAFGAALASALPTHVAAQPPRPPAAAEAAPRDVDDEAPPDRDPAARLAPITVEGQRLRYYEGNEGLKAEFQGSATKTPLPLRETPQSVSVITQDSLEARQVIDFGQALETAASVNQYSGPGPFGGVSAFGFQMTQIRGVTLDARYDIRTDGFIGLPFYASLDLALFQRIEVVKGPSSLYGRGSAGGFINRITKKPLPAFRAELETSIGSYDFYRVEGDVTGPLFDSEAARGRLILVYQDAGSFVDGVESQLGLVAPSVELDLGARTSLLLQGIYQQREFISNSGFPLQRDGERFKAPDVSRSLFFGVPGPENQWEIYSGTALLEHHLNDNWLASLRLNRAASDNPIDMNNYAYGLAANGDTSLYSSFFEPNSTDVWSGELRLEGAVELLGRPASLVVGVGHSQSETHRADAFVGLGTANIYAENFADFPTQEPTISRDVLTEQESTGAYAQVLLRPLERLSLLLGARYDMADTWRVDRLAPGSQFDREDDELTGRIGLTFDVSDHIAVYGLYAESFQPALFAVGPDNEILDPETGDIIEAGIKTEWLDQRLGIKGAVFRIDRENIAIPDPANGPGEFFSIASGLQRTEGVELEIDGEPLSGWHLSFAASLLDSEFLDRDDPFFGSTPAGTADWQIGLFTRYEFANGPLEDFGFGAGLFAIDDRGISTFVPDAKLVGYERLDLHASYDGFEPMVFRLLVRNLFDERYVEGADRTAAYAQFGSPAAVLVSAQYQFGDGDQ